MFLFENRLDGGIQLAKLIDKLVKNSPNQPSPVVYALPRGGLPVGEAIANRLECPLSVLVSKKISLPSNPELAMGAITAEGDTIWTSYLDNVTQPELIQAKEKAYQKARQQWDLFAPLCSKINCQGAIAILADDGIATGMTIAAAAMSLKKHHPQAIWIAAPVAPPHISEELRPWCDRVIVIKTPDPFFSVSRFYVDFPQLSDQEALNILANFRNTNS